jgi:hypothetical protein
MTRVVPPARVRMAHVEWVADRLSDRDFDIITTVNQLRLATAVQLERLHFAELSEASRARNRRRVLSRLADWRVLAALERRIGGVRAGSSGLVFALDSAGQGVLRLTANGSDRPVRRPYTPSLPLLRHTLAISELYVSLVELGRSQGFEVTEFETEPACWWSNGLGGWLKPDTYIRLSTADNSYTWWLEQDMGTEHLPTIRRKLFNYLDFVERGQLGPGDVVPRVLVSTTKPERRDAIQLMVRQLPEPAGALFVVVVERDTALHMLVSLKE